MSDLAERVKKIVVEHLDVDMAKVEPKASFIDDLGADSLDIVELVMAFEEEFDVEFPMTPLRPFKRLAMQSSSSKNKKADRPFIN